MSVVTAAPILHGSTRARFYGALADPCRLSILSALTEGTRTVGDLVERTGRSQSNTSNHLACLLGCGLVARERRGRYVHYRLADPRLADLLTLADDVIADITGGLDACANHAPVDVPEHPDGD